MLVLAIDTCLARCAVCLFDSSQKHALAQEHLDMQRGHAEALAPMVQRVIASSGKKIGDIERISVTTGPGTFTGLRIGLSFARALGLARNIPVIGTDTLQAFRLSTDQKTLALPSGNSGYAFVSVRGQHQIELVPVEEVDPSDFVAGTPDLIAVAQWAASQAATNQMPEPVYIRAPDAKPQVIVKQVHADAATKLSTLHHSAFTKGWSAEEIANMFEVTGTVALLAEIANEAVGFAIIRSIADQAELLTIATLPSRRKLGVASRLLSHALPAARALGATTMFLDVAASNTAAHQLYFKLGFTESGRRKSYYATGDDAILMLRNLN